MKRIIISGGGTGGHIYPAITIYKEIMKQKMGDWKIMALARCYTLAPNKDLRLH